MYSIKSKVLLLSCLLAAVLFSCKKWDDHIAGQGPALSGNLMEQISKKTELSKFAEYLTKTGFDKEISSSKTYTVFAPTNDALATLAADVIADTAKLKAFLRNHISNQLFFTRMAVDSLRVPMLNGKRVFFIGKKFDDANVAQADITVQNGVLHVIDKMVPPLQNAWEYLVANSTTAVNQNAFIASLTYTIQDTTLAVLDSINPVTGQPVYKPNTGIVTRNRFTDQVQTIANEDSLYTYIVLNNAAYTTEYTKLAPYFKAATTNATIANSAWTTVKDLAFKGLYQPAQLTNLLSKFGARVTVNPANIVETRKVSNGVVYVVNAISIPLADKIPTVIIQGEFPISLKAYDDKYVSKLFRRQRFNTFTNLPFNDIYMNLGSSGANYYIDYVTNGLLSTKYKVYWVALNDKVISGQGDDPYGTDSTMQQILQIGPDSTVSKPTFIYTPTFSVQTGIRPYTYTETLIGEYTNGSFEGTTWSPNTFTAGTRRVRLMAPAALTGIPYNLTCDYIKFVPQF